MKKQFMPVISITALFFVSGCAISAGQAQQKPVSTPTTYEECVESISDNLDLSLEEVQQHVWRCREEFTP